MGRLVSCFGPRYAGWTKASTCGRAVQVAGCLAAHTMYIGLKRAARCSIVSGGCKSNVSQDALRSAIGFFDWIGPWKLGGALACAQG